jgi:hypothetical protein
MQYMKCDWHIADPTEPITIYSELDENRWETRKVHVFADGRRERAGPNEETENTALSIEPIPSLDSIAADSQFHPSEITKEEFERIWQSV